MVIFWQLLISGVLAGGVYALMAVGLTLTFGVLKLPNFAHGEFVMIAMFATYFLYLGLGINPYIAAIPVALAMFVVGLLIERIVLRKAIGQGDMVQIFLTVGLSLFLMNLALVLFGGDYKRIPISFAASSFHLGKYYIAMPQAYAFIAAMCVMGFLHWLLNFTFMGKAIRAVSEDRNTAQLMGIKVDRIYALTFGLGLAFTGTSAALLATLYPVFPTVGAYFILIAFVVVVLGGLGSAPGALVGGLFIGVVESLSGYYVGQGWKQAVYFALFILVLIVRPNGIFGRAQVR